MDCFVSHWFWIIVGRRAGDANIGIHTILLVYVSVYISTFEPFRDMFPIWFRGISPQIWLVWVGVKFVEYLIDLEVYSSFDSFRRLRPGVWEALVALGGSSSFHADCTRNMSFVMTVMRFHGFIWLGPRCGTQLFICFHNGIQTLEQRENISVCFEKMLFN